MDPLDFARRNRLIIVAGKGGVGTTTVSAALATMAARAGLRVLIVGVDTAAGLPRLFGADSRLEPATIGYEPVTLFEAAGEDGVNGLVEARVITSDRALLEWLAAKGFGRLASRLAAGGTLEVISTAAPGIEDILVLGRIKAIVNEATHDLVIVDTPASGHAVQFLRSASGLMDAATVGPIREQALAVHELLTDHERCEVVLVTLAEETPVNETIETADVLEDVVGVALAAVVINQVLQRPDVGGERSVLQRLPVALRRELEALLQDRAQRTDQQDAHIERLLERLPIPSAVLPALSTVGLGPNDLHRLADALQHSIESW
jgi:anion-transporting  ArsA/GET3 family ATPase